MLDILAPAFRPNEGDDWDETPNVLSTPLGDGYTQDVGNGINSLLQKGDWNWSNLTNAQGNAILTFVRNKKGYLRFAFLQNGEAAYRCFKATGWKPKYKNGGFMDLKVTYQECALSAEDTLPPPPIVVVPPGNGGGTTDPGTLAGSLAGDLAQSDIQVSVM